MIYDRFGKIVTLIKSIGPIIAPFILFMFLILVFFTGCYTILGENFAKDEDSINSEDVPKWMFTFMTVFEISIG